MNRDELLTKLAMTLSEWALDSGHARRSAPYCEWITFDGGLNWRAEIEGGAQDIRESDWLQRRQELINCPPDSEAPEWAEWKAQNENGQWQWLQCGDAEPYGDVWLASYKQENATKGIIPSGHDWRTTLTRINRDDNISTPEEDEEFERIQARQDADKPHEADARILDEQLADAMGKQPRYLDATGEDWIDEFARTATLDEFRGAMRFTIGKYNRRVGRKDEVLKEVRKMKDYCARWEAYEIALADKGRGL